jgi:hypothetical protein
MLRIPGSTRWRTWPPGWRLRAARRLLGAVLAGCCASASRAPWPGTTASCTSCWPRWTGRQRLAAPAGLGRVLRGRRAAVPAPARGAPAQAPAARPAARFRARPPPRCRTRCWCVSASDLRDRVVQQRRLLGLLASPHRRRQALHPPAARAACRRLAAGRRRRAADRRALAARRRPRLSMRLIDYTPTEAAGRARHQQADAAGAGAPRLRRQRLARTAHAADRGPRLPRHARARGHPEWAGILAEMRRQSRRMTQIVEDLLTLSRLEAQRPPADDRWRCAVLAGLRARPRR